MEYNCGIFEWTIENFSWWSYEIHGNITLYMEDISYSSSSKEQKLLELFPKGLNWEKEHLVISFCNRWLSGEFEISFIGSDGSLIKTESICVKKEDTTFTYTGPMFKNVIARIRENEPFHKDKLTLRFRKKPFFDHRKRQVHTMIDVFNSSLKLNCEIFIGSSINMGTWENISDIQYPLEDGKKVRFDFSVFKTASTSDANLIFKLRPVGLNRKNILAQICVTHLHCDESIIKYEETEHIFTEYANKWISMKSMPMQELQNKVSFILISLKIATGNISKTYSCRLYYPDETEISLTDNKKVPGENISQNPRAVTSPDISMDVLTKELICLYQDQDFSDFQLRCGQNDFFVHKGILSARSPVFKTMLSSDMSETVSGSVDIEDLDPPTLTRFLAFLYSGKVDDLQWDRALKLYYAADKYQVPTLKRECVSVLSSDVSILNVCEILSLADKHQDDELTSVAHGFILKNYNEVLKSKEWMDFMTVGSNLLLKTLTLFAQKDFVKSAP